MDVQVKNMDRPMDGALDGKLMRPNAKIAILRALQLGDMLCAIPAIRALRNAYPTAEITLVGLPWANSLLKRFPGYFDAFVHFKGWPGLPEQLVDPIEAVGFLKQMQDAKFDLVLQMQGNGNLVNPMVELWAGKLTAGFYTTCVYYPKSQLFIEYPSQMHEIERHLALIKNMGINAMGTYMEFPLTEDDQQAFNEMGITVVNKKYVCIHPGSRGKWRQWPTSFFAKMGNYCVEQGMDVLITGTKEELPIAEEVANLMKYSATVIAGKTTLGSLAILIKGAFMLISNCTGPSHIAAALQTPSVVISMDGEPERWAPLNHQLHRTIDWIKTPDFHLVYTAMINLFSTYSVNP